MAPGTDDVYKSAEAVKLCGGKIVPDPGPIPVTNTKITACMDPVACRKIGIDDYVVEKCFGRKIMGY